MGRGDCWGGMNNECIKFSWSNWCFFVGRQMVENGEFREVQEDVSTSGSGFQEGERNIFV